MKPRLDEDGLQLYHGEAAAVLATLPEKSVQCVVTSPPYWGLRNYGTAEWVGGDPKCAHEEDTPKRRPGATSQRKGRTKQQAHTPKGVCGCGAQRVDLSLGHERTPEEYVARLVALFRDVRRVLRDDGTVWLNLGDSYLGTGKGGHSAEKRSENWAPEYDGNKASQKVPEGFKAKDAALIPWRVGLALHADGWWVRADIVWAKPNGMPESVMDRPTKNHEYVLLLAKRERYFYDADAVREPYSEGSKARYAYPFGGNDSARAARTPSVGGDKAVQMAQNPAGRAMRTVWTFPTEPSPLPHFAAFPEELARRCILAGTSAKGACDKCGAPWKPLVEVAGETPRERLKARGKADAAAAHSNPQGLNHKGAHVAPERVRQRVGWEHSCAHKSTKAEPCVVLDPFAGTGTTLKVARDLGRRAIGIDLSAEYCGLAVRRLRYGKRGAKKIEGGKVHKKSAAPETARQPSLMGDDL